VGDPSVPQERRHVPDLRESRERIGELGLGAQCRDCEELAAGEPWRSGRCVPDAVIASRLPVIASRLPVIASRLPVVASRLAVIASRLPVVASRLAVIASRLPVVASRLPVVASRLPVIASRLVIVGSSLAVVAGSAAIIAGQVGMGDDAPNRALRCGGHGHRTDGHRRQGRSTSGGL
jgi:tyrosine kinase 3